MFFQCELQKIYLNRDRAGKISWKFWNLAAKLNGNFSRSEIPPDIWWMHALQYIGIFTMVAPQPKELPSQVGLVRAMLQ